MNKNPLKNLLPRLLLISQKKRKRKKKTSEKLVVFES